MAEMKDLSIHGRKSSTRGRVIMDHLLKERRVERM
jgi:hypothetical protein